MKTSHAIGLVAVSVLITVAVEESRIASLRSAAKVGEPTTAAPAKAPVTASTEASDNPAPPVRTKSRSEEKPAPPAKEPTAAADEESLATTARKMWDNPAGKSMMNQGVKMAVGMMYQDFIDGLDLTKEEADYFKNLLGKEMADQQELGMKMLGASEEERKSLGEELAKRGSDAEQEIRNFLNNDEDYKKFTDYKNHLPERQQLDGIRATMTNKGLTLDPETENRLVDAMYRARTEAKVPDYSGPGALEEMAKGNLVENFEKTWEVQQETLRAEAGKVLNEAQMAAFQEYQRQAKEMQLMGLKMADKMMNDEKKKPE